MIRAVHECPMCGVRCDCDGDDLEVSWPYNADCEHDCDENEPNEGEDYEC